MLCPIKLSQAYALERDSNPHLAAVLLIGFEPIRLPALGFEPSVSSVPPQEQGWYLIQLNDSEVKPAQGRSMGTRYSHSPSEAGLEPALPAVAAAGIEPA